MMKNIMLMMWVVMTLLLNACGSSDKTEKSGKNEIITLISKPLSTTLFYSGMIQPLKTHVITSPADGVIQDMSFHFGDTVKSGVLLYTISSEKFQSDYKTALMQYIKAKNEYNTSQGQLIQSEFLHKNKLISTDELKAKKNSYYTAQLSLVQAKDALTSMLKQLTIQGWKVDELSIENIDKIIQVLHTQGDSQKLRIMAPVAGEVLLPSKAEGDSELKKIGKGDQIKQGDVLAVIGDVNGLTIRVNVNEFNINQLKVGQPVKVTGAAFPDIVLQGSIAGIDRQGQANSGGMPTFPIEIIVSALTPEQKKIIHIGMSAKVEINIDSEPHITVPLAAIFEKQGQTYVHAQDPKTGKIHEVLVKAGQTTLDAVVIESSLKAGDKIVFTR